MPSAESVSETGTMTHVRIDCRGDEVAKWLQRTDSAKWQRPGTPIAPGVTVVHSEAPVYLESEDALQLSTLGAAEVSFRVRVEGTDLVAAVEVALATANDALGGLLSRVEALRIEVEHRYGS